MSRRVLRTDSRSGVLALVAALALLVSLTMSFFSSPASAAVLTRTDQLAICHHDNGKPVYNYITPNINALFAAGHDTHAMDIIPPFDFDLGAGVVHFPGLNATPANLAVLANQCNPVPAGPTHISPGTPRGVASSCNGTVLVPASFTVPTTPHITYSPATGGPATPGSTVHVTATADTGYVIDFNGGSGPTAVLDVLIPSTGPTTCNGSTTGGNTTTTGGSTTGGSTTGGSTTGGTPVVNNLGISKTGPGNAVPGDELVWNLAVTNTSGDPATGFVVTDVLANGLSYSLAQGTDFVCNAALQVISCTYNGSLAAGSTANVVVRALLDSTYDSVLVRNVATVDPHRSDSNAADNSSTADTNITLPTAGGGSIGGGTTGGAVSPPKKPVVKPATGGGGGGGGALPFTGSHTAQLVQTGLAMFLLGWYFVTVGRRRPEHAR